ncbi:metal ABC transporter substrate-binding protein [Candidatus Uabimicrobium amorphum]|uniref:Adhesin n=1 Tax=Uabimicrobium amorphum TaxID=2596890 RepID=A0A5S9F297_UABAM|nr:metal ABC transporter substrate-binding protein [Candidatus Uabimicrobium amorphum]BBM83435.1 adhesin [Candidatus Uabimicrobium amorphum]
MKFVFSILVFLLLLGCDTGSKTDSSASDKSKLKVCVTTTDLKDIVDVVAGEHINLYCFTDNCSEGDPHELDITNEFVRQLNKADLLIDVGMGIAEGWLPELLKSAKRPELFRGKERHLEIAKVIRPLANPEDHAYENSVHAEGNPHFLLDPTEGIRAARFVCEKLSELVPAHKDDFVKNYENFRNEISKRLVGEDLAKKYDVEKLVVLNSENKLKEFLASKNDYDKLSGWIKEIESLRGTLLVGDHDLWPYMARSYGFEMLGYIEAEPGIPPTTKHLQELIKKVKEKKLKVLLTCSYFDKRHVKFVAEKTGVKVLLMAHQVRSVKGADTYIKMLEHNFKLLSQGLKN